MSSTTAPRVSPKKRAQRLRRELNELLNSPVDNCSAFPLEDQIDIWHANIYVPSLDVHFHFEITYPKNYPNKAPKVKNLTHISHKNVFGSYICLDILTMSEETANTPFRGWTSAYTISSLLVQLQSFLFEAVAERNGSRMKREALSYRCTRCPHHGNKVVHPEIACMVAKPGQPKWKPESVAKAYAWEFLQEVPVVVIQCLCTFLEQTTVTSIRVLCDDKDSKKAIDGVLKKIVYKCFYTLKDLNDEDVVLGLGAKKDIMPRRSRKTKTKAGQLQRLHCSFDYISHEAYEMGVRNNVWKDRDFDSFIPLVINSKHARKSIPLAEKCIMDIWKDYSITHRPRTLTDNIVLETLSKLMNTTVVNMMKTVEDLEAGEIQLFDSIKALEGYTSFHHLLLAFVHKYPSIKDIANEKGKL
jgi:ubiquitin-protein ligase